MDQSTCILAVPKVERGGGGGGACLVCEKTVTLLQSPVLRGQLIGSTLELLNVTIQLLRTVPCDLAPCWHPLGPCTGILDDVLKGQGSVQHDGLLAGDHLLVYGVVKVGHLL